MSSQPVHSLNYRPSYWSSSKCVSVATNAEITGNSIVCGVEITAALVKRGAEYRGEQRFADGRVQTDNDAVIAQLNSMGSGAGLLLGKTV